MTKALEKDEITEYFRADRQYQDVMDDLDKQRSKENNLLTKLESERMEMRCPCCSSRVYGEKNIKKLDKWLHKNTTITKVQ